MSEGIHTNCYSADYHAHVYLQTRGESRSKRSTIRIKYDDGKGRARCQKVATITRRASAIVE
eukprot:7138404-Pyramimonas_sp.AAC.1